MVTEHPTSGDPDGNPAITEIELAAVTFTAHSVLNAVEMTVVSPDGGGFRCWIGADQAPAAALHFCAATVRLVEGITT